MLKSQQLQELVEALGVTAELTGTELSVPAIKVMAGDLARFPLPQVLAALTRCRRELKGRLTIADVVSRLDDGRPGPEEAWALMPKGEGQTVVWTAEMAQAFGICAPLLDRDEVAARMVFKESYSRLLSDARNIGTPAKWTPSLGHDPSGREGVLLEAVKMGRLPRESLRVLLPYIQIEQEQFSKLLKAMP